MFSGEYIVFISAEHLLNNGSPDGNLNSVAYNFTLVDTNVHQLIIDSNSYLSDAILGKIVTSVISFASKNWEGQNQGESETLNIKKFNLIDEALTLLFFLGTVVLIGGLLGFGVWYVKKRFF